VKAFRQAIGEKVFNTVFPEKPADIEILRQAITEKIITAVPVGRSELININMLKAAIPKKRNK